MSEVEMELDDKGQGSFYIYENNERIAKMVFGISGDKLTVYHTEVDPEDEGQGLAKKLLAALVAYARKNKLKVYPLCAFVALQFKRNPREYEDIWEK
ncbi:MAG: GNAT family N-acetyltransferase [Ginsengibacter sp.]